MTEIQAVIPEGNEVVEDFDAGGGDLDALTWLTTYRAWLERLEV